MNHKEIDKYIAGLGIEGAEEELNRISKAVDDNPNGERWMITVLTLDDITKKAGIDNFPSGLLIGIMLYEKYPEVAKEYREFIFSGIKKTLGGKGSENDFNSIVEGFTKSWEGNASESI